MYPNPTPSPIIRSENWPQAVYFYCCSLGPPEATAYSHKMICLAEGFKALGIPFYSNRNYWRTSPEQDEYLFQHDPNVTPDDCSIVILDGTWFEHECDPESSFLSTLFHPSRSYITVYIDHHDKTKTLSWRPEFRPFDLIFKAHYNVRSKYPENFHPSAFGLSGRMLRELDDVVAFDERERAILFNFRCDHSLRKVARQRFGTAIQPILPIDETVEAIATVPLDAYDHLMWAQTGRRHHPEYFKRLKRTAAVATFGGIFASPWPRDLGVLDQVSYRTLNKILQYVLPSKRVFQWDSWRFWEALAAGCVAFHVDFETYGLGLPVMPENWTHYIGIDFDHLQATIDRIADQPEVLAHISTAGRQWAIDHYSPVPTALRFLNTISGKLKTSVH